MQKDNKKILHRIILLSLFLFILSFNFISSAQIQTIQTEIGLDVEYPQIFYVEQGENTIFRTAPINTSNGVELGNPDASCNFRLVDSKGIILVSQNMLNDSSSFYTNVSGGNFSDLGFYSYGIYCNTSETGGFSSVSFEVTPSGKGGSANIVFFIFVIVLLYTLTFVGFFGRNIPITILGGMALLFLGVYMIRYGIIIYRDNLTNYISYITIGVGGITSFWAILEQFDVI